MKKAFQFILGLFIFGIMSSCGGNAPKTNCQDGPHNPCVNTNKELIDDVSITMNDGRGYQIELYHVQKMPNVKKVAIRDYSPEGFNEERLIMFKELVTDLYRKTRDPMCKLYLDNINNNTINAEDIATGESHHHYIISISDEKAAFDCRSCEHIHTMSVIMAKNEIYRVPEEIRALIEKQIREDRRLEGEIRHMISSGAATIDLSKVIDTLTHDPNFRRAIKPLLRKYGKVLEYFDVETRHILEQKENFVGFPIGEFKLNMVSKLALDHIYESVETLIGNDPSKKYKVIIKGYTDQSNIGDKGIPYEGEAHYSADGVMITTENSSSFSRIGNKIRNNPQLSYARAYTGYEFFKNQLEGNEDFKRNENIQLAYQGMGVDSRATNLWAKRRIEFKIEEL